MPLRDHFRPPLSKRKNWEGFHGLWPGLITVDLNQRLPPRFEAEPSVHLGSEIEVDVATLESEQATDSDHSLNGDLAFDFAQPTLVTASEYEVRIFDTDRNRRLVAAIEIISPSNKDRPESRHIFVAKCQAMLKMGVSITIVDLVTSKNFNLYADLLDLVGQSDPTFGPEPSPIYAAACRWIPRDRKHVLETWSHVLQLELPLPTLPIWLAENCAIPLELETSYEQTCRALRIA